MEEKLGYSFLKNTKVVSSILSYLVFSLIVFSVVAVVSVFCIAQAQDQLVKNHPADDSLSREIQQKYANFPLYFIENQGQVSSADVRYYLVERGKQVFFADKYVMFYLLKKDKKQEQEQVRGVALKLEFKNSEETKPVGKEQQVAKVNYFRGSDPAQWKSNIPTYASVLYPNVYKGIDMLWCSERGNLKYQFIVQPGADPKKIQLLYSGIESLSVSPSGELVIKTSLGEILEQKPYVYQEINGTKIEIPAKFRIAKSKSKSSSSFSYGFELGTYNSNYPLVIDPLIYSTFLGGSKAEVGFNIAVDNVGNVYITGETLSSNFPTTPGAFDTTYNGNWDVFVSKLSLVTLPITEVDKFIRQLY